MNSYPGRAGPGAEPFNYVDHQRTNGPANEEPTMAHHEIRTTVYTERNGLDVNVYGKGWPIVRMAGGRIAGAIVRVWPDGQRADYGYGTTAIIRPDHTLYGAVNEHAFPIPGTYRGEVEYGGIILASFEFEIAAP